MNCGSIDINVQAVYHKPLWFAIKPANANSNASMTSLVLQERQSTLKLPTETTRNRALLPCTASTVAIFAEDGVTSLMFDIRFNCKNLTHQITD